jgi:hypothetical protein
MIAVKILALIGIALLLTVGVGGCATSGRGNAPGAQSGNARNGATLPSETLLPGVGSALFPDPAF